MTKLKDNLKSIDILKFNKSYCNYHIKKNGKIKFIPNNNYIYLCILNKTKYFENVIFPYLYGNNENDIVKKLFILYILQKKNPKYIEINKINDKNYKLYLFDISNIHIGLEILFLKYQFNLEYITKKKKISEYKYIKFFYGTKIRILSTYFMIYKLTENTSDKKILIQLFYIYYIKLIIKDLYKKHKKILNDFKNYNELYIFLKDKGYVDKYYNYYGPKMINNFNKFYKKLIEHPLIEKFKKKNLHKIKNLNDIDLIKLIDNHVDNKYNKEYIKNKFNKLKEKYNI
jgi:hypothetical protein